MPLDPGTLDSVNNANFKAVAEQLALLSNMQMQNAIAHQNRLNILAETALSNAIDRLGTVSVEEGLGISAAQRGDLAKQISDLAAAVTSIQQSIKTAQTTPPITVPPPATA